MQREVRVAEEFAGHQDEVSLVVGQNGFGLLWGRDDAHGSRRDTCFLLDALGKLHLVARSHRNVGVGHVAASRGVNQVDLLFFQDFGQRYRFLDGPATLGPVGSRDAHHQLLLGWPDLAHGINYFEQQPDTVFE